MNQVQERTISDDAMKMLQAHHWQGNVRELENTIHRAVLLATGDDISTAAILLPDASGNISFGAAPVMASLDSDSATPTGGATDAEDSAATLVGKTVAEVERELIIDTLKHCLGNRTHAANILGISIRTLRNKLNQYQTEGVSVPQPGAPG